MAREILSQEFYVLIRIIDNVESLSYAFDTEEALLLSEMLLKLEATCKDYAKYFKKSR